MSDNLSISIIADAIRKNGLEQIKRDYIKYEYDPITGLKSKPYAACALGQAEVNLGVNVYVIQDYLMKITDHKYFECPAMPEDIAHTGVLPNVIIDLNDYHGWTFVQIADWMDSINA